MKNRYNGRLMNRPEPKPSNDEVLQELINCGYQTYEILDRYRQATNDQSIDHEEIESRFGEYCHMPESCRQSYTVCEDERVEQESR